MHLKFEDRHLSITDFPEIDLPQLTVIVGLNGAGKSHLLQAIQNGSVSNSVAPIHRNRTIDPARSPVRLLTLGDTAPNFGTGYVSALSGNQQPMQIDEATRFEQLRTNVLEPFEAELNVLSEGRLNSVFAGRNVWQIKPLKIAEELGLNNLVKTVDDIFQRAETTLQQLKPNHPSPRIRHRPGPSDDMVWVAAQQASTNSGIPMYALQADHMRLFKQWGQIDQFAVNLPMIFGRYRDAQLKNWMLQKEDELKDSNHALTNEKFRDKFGPAPWALISSTLTTFSLPYEVTSPCETDNSNVIVQFRNKCNGEIISFQNLSSGEKILTQFAISTFHYDATYISVNSPKVLLLDEMDSSLHPEMLARWLRAIQRGLVGEQQMHCILATHSPTTVALAPEEALFEMIDGRLGLKKIAKQEALNKLTFGVPTLSIDYTGRRQVFTESDTDAAIYESVYALIKSKISCHKELNFLSTGLRDKDNGEINSGCSVVKNIVERLAELGNSSIFGIIDWDGKAISTNRIKVVAEDERNGIENVLLDPLLICLLLMKENQAPADLDDINRFAGADHLSEYDLQRLIDAIQLPLFPQGTADKVEVQYLGGSKCFVLRAYLEADDHVLEDELCKQFPVLTQWHRKGKGHGTLVKTVVQHVLREHSYFCPVALQVIFEAIANA